MKYVLLVFQGTTPLPGTDRWKALPEAEQKRIYADYAALNQTPGMTPGLPLGLPGAARTVQVQPGPDHPVDALVGAGGSAVPGPCRQSAAERSEPARWIPKDRGLRRRQSK